MSFSTPVAQHGTRQPRHNAGTALCIIFGVGIHVPHGTERVVMRALAIVGTCGPVACRCVSREVTPLYVDDEVGVGFHARQRP